MSNKREYGWILLVLILLIAFTAYMFSGGGNNSATVQRLPDGSLMRLAAVSYGINHTYRHAAVTGWRKKVGQFLPNSMLARLGWSKVSGGLTIGTPVGSTNLVIFTERIGITNGSTLETRTVVFDEQENYFDAGNTQGTLVMSDGTNSSRVDGWGFPAFPRRGNRVGLRILARQSGGDWQRAAEFRIPNPVPGKYPEWQAEVLPATKSNGDLTVTLESLESGRAKTNLTGRREATKLPSHGRRFGHRKLAPRPVRGGQNRWRFGMRPAIIGRRTRESFRQNTKARRIR